MFAHQVISDLENAVKNFSAGSIYEIASTEIVRRELLLYEAQLRSSIEDIKTSQKFHFDGEQVWMQTAHLVDITKPFRIFDDFPEYMKLPFNKVWLDWDHADKVPRAHHEYHKKGLLIEKDRPTLPESYETQSIETWSITQFLFMEDGIWGMTPAYFSVKPDHSYVYVDKTFPSQEISAEQYQRHIWGDLRLLEHFLLLINCKNIEVINHLAPEKLNKKREAKGLTPLFTYHTLHVKVFKQKRKAFESVDPTNIHNRVHLCRGHFKEYTAEAPLFGKYTGLWWWQPNIRGQNRKGIVMKDYEVNTERV